MRLRPCRGAARGSETAAGDPKPIREEEKKKKRKRQSERMRAATSAELASSWLKHGGVLMSVWLSLYLTAKSSRPRRCNGYKGKSNQMHRQERDPV